MNQSPTWDLYRSMLAVVRDGSLSGAARSLGLTQPTLARHIEQLETALNATLFTRSPRGLQPTETALALMPHAEAMAAAAASAMRAASVDREAEISGDVRIAASEVIGAEVLPAILRDFRVDHPGVKFELDLSSQTVDLLRRDADIAVRMTRPRQGPLVAKRIDDIGLGLHAHRAYLDAHGTPADLADLAGHTVIGFDRDTAVIQTLRGQGLSVTREMFSYRTDNDLASLAAIRAGCGIGVCQIGLGRRDPGLIHLLPDLVSLRLETWITMHEGLKGDRRMRLVFDHLVSQVGAYAATSALKV